VLLHYHLTFPLSNLLLLLLGLPFVLRPGSRSLLLGMVIAIMICGAYFAFDAMCRNFGEKGELHPVLAAWFGVIFFGSLGIVLLDSVKT
jgi:lipopolysaccharide export LptBFGC system permease protein LptF